ncbi:branched-chain amino acid transport system ATP-binding protein [Bradyrhizobium sp. USDA 4011]
MLAVEDLHAYYGDSHVVQGISLAVGAHECVALLGRNGAGKSTTLKAIVGLVPSRKGKVVFGDRQIERLPTYRIARTGIAYVPEDRGIFPSVTVDEHLGIAMKASRGRPSRKTADYAYELFPRLAERRRSLGGQLSGGEQQMLAIGRALLCGPDLLILDEPSEGLAPVIVDHLGDVLERIRDEGTPILLVEQNYQLAARLAHRAYVLSQGGVQFAGTMSALDSDEAARRTYLSI